MSPPYAPLLASVVLAGILHRTSGQDGDTTSAPPAAVVPWGRDPPETVTIEQCQDVAFSLTGGFTHSLQKFNKKGRSKKCDFTGAVTMLDDASDVNVTLSGTNFAKRSKNYYGSDVDDHCSAINQKTLVEVVPRFTRTIGRPCDGGLEVLKAFPLAAVADCERFCLQKDDCLGFSYDPAEAKACRMYDRIPTPADAAGAGDGTACYAAQAGCPPAAFPHCDIDVGVTCNVDADPAMDCQAYANEVHVSGLGKPSVLPGDGGGSSSSIALSNPCEVLLRYNFTLSPTATTASTWTWATRTRRGDEPASTARPREYDWLGGGGLSDPRIPGAGTATFRSTETVVVNVCEAAKYKTAAEAVVRSDADTVCTGRRQYKLTVKGTAAEPTPPAPEPTAGAAAVDGGEAAPPPKPAPDNEEEEQVFCTADVFVCSEDPFVSVSRDPANDCAFPLCPPKGSTVAAVDGGDPVFPPKPAPDNDEEEEQVFCTADVFVCSEDPFVSVSRDPANDCAFPTCPPKVPAEPEGGSSVAAVDGGDPVFPPKPAPDNDEEEQVFCAADVFVCSEDPFVSVSRDPANDCAFPTCPPKVPAEPEGGFSVDPVAANCGFEAPVVGCVIADGQVGPPKDWTDTIDCNDYVPATQSDCTRQVRYTYYVYQEPTPGRETRLVQSLRYREGSYWETNPADAPHGNPRKYLTERWGTVIASDDPKTFYELNQWEGEVVNFCRDGSVETRYQFHTDGGGDGYEECDKSGFYTLTTVDRTPNPDPPTPRPTRGPTEPGTEPDCIALELSTACFIDDDETRPCEEYDPAAECTATAVYVHTIQNAEPFGSGRDAVLTSVMRNRPGDVPHGDDFDFDLAVPFTLEAAYRLTIKESPVINFCTDSTSYVTALRVESTLAGTNDQCVDEDSYTLDLSTQSSRDE